MCKVHLLNNILKFEFSVDKAMQEIGFLFKNDKDVTEELKKALTVCKAEKHYIILMLIIYMYIMYKNNQAVKSMWPLNKPGW